MSRLTNAKKRKLAERLFIEDGMTAAAIADMLDVAPKTIGSWRKGHKGEKTWDERRLLYKIAPSAIKEAVLARMKEESEKNEPSADKLIKLGNTIKAIDKEISVHLVVSVFKEFDMFMNEADPDMGLKFLEYHKRFIQFKATD